MEEIDVSKCRFYNNGCDSHILCTGDDDIYGDCYYKQFKRKEKEVQTLRSALQEIKEIAEENRMNDELVLFHIIFVIIVIAILGLVFGCIVGHTLAVRHNTDVLCKQIKTTTNEYFACKQKDFSEVIKEIISEVEE